MPKAGYKAITLNENAYNIILRLKDKANEEAGYKKYRSVSHYVEVKIMEEVKRVEENQKKKKREKR